MSFDIATIRDAAHRLEGRISRTPLLESPQLNDVLGARVFVKAESLQLTGSFKVRGALNKMLLMSTEERAPGVAAYSAGNHGQGVAAAARLLGVPAVVVMPSTAPEVKVENCRWWGAEVVRYDPAREDRVVITRTISDSRGMVLNSPFDDHEVMSGQGTVGLETVADLENAGVIPDAVLVSCSGGGLASGVVEVFQHSFSEIKSYIVESSGSDKMARSLLLGRPVTLDTTPATIMDALAGPTAGTLTFQALARHQVTGVTVDDHDVLDAMGLAFRNLRIVVEPGGAAAPAAVMTHPQHFRGKTIVVVASGGNVDPAVFARALARPRL